MEIEGFENYLIYEDGRVWSKFGKGRFLKPTVNTAGYLNVCLYKDGKQKQMVIHRLVGNAYIPNHENKPEIDHIDRNKQNNNISNLRWVTRSENQRNKHVYGAVAFRGVYKNRNRFKATITIDGKKEYIGLYKTAEEASEAYINFKKENNIML
jgi:hypothetical protein